MRSLKQNRFLHALGTPVKLENQNLIAGRESAQCAAKNGLLTLFVTVELGANTVQLAEKMN